MIEHIVANTTTTFVDLYNKTNEIIDNMVDKDGSVVNNMVVSNTTPISANSVVSKSWVGSNYVANTYAQSHFVANTYASSTFINKFQLIINW